MTTVETSVPVLNPAAGIGFGFFMSDAVTSVERIQRVEQAGIDNAWLVMPAQSYDTVTIAASALAQTSTVRVGTSIVPVFTRHPLALASQAMALHELAPDRFRLGIGTGNLVTMADAFGTPIPKPVGQMREYLEVLGGALATGKAQHHGTYYSVDTELPIATGTPVTLAALGPRMFGLAGELAQAAMSWLCPVDYLDAVARPALDAGAERVGRPAPPLIVHVVAVVEPDAKAARAIARPMFGWFARNPHYAAMFAGAGLPVDEAGEPSDALIDGVVVSGDETGLTDRLGELAEQQDELLVTLQADGPGNDEEATLLRALGNVSRSLAGVG